MKISLSRMPVRTEKINCIKAARFAFAGIDGTGMGLKEAKDAVEAAPVQPDGTITMEGEKHHAYSLDTICGLIHSREFHNQMLGCGMSAVIVEELSGIETNGNQVFNVPNDDNGKRFMEDCAKYINRPQFSIRRRGRGARPSKQFHSSLPLGMSEWVAVYIDGCNNGNADEIRQLKASLETLRKENEGLRTLLNTANTTIADNSETIDSLHNCVDTLRGNNSSLLTENSALRSKDTARMQEAVIKIGGQSIRIVGATGINIL